MGGGTGGRRNGWTEKDQEIRIGGTLHFFFLFSLSLPGDEAGGHLLFENVKRMDCHMLGPQSLVESVLLVVTDG